MCWASLMAGGSCAAIPVSDQAFLYELTQMSPCSPEDGTFLLKGPSGWLVYRDAATWSVDLGKEKYVLYSIDAKTGTISRKKDVSGTLSLPDKGIFWLHKR
jgi:hypothetical protein